MGDRDGRGSETRINYTVSITQNTSAVVCLNRPFFELKFQVHRESIYNTQLQSDTKRKLWVASFSGSINQRDIRGTLLQPLI